MSKKHEVCPDHWHCDPREAAHRCDVSDRTLECPSCGERPDEDYSCWVTQDGRRIPLVEMDQLHIENTFGYLERTQIARAAGKKVDGSGAHAAQWLRALSAELERRRVAGTLVDTRRTRRGNPGIRLQRDWRWNGRPLRVRVVRSDNAFTIAWDRWFGRRGGGGEWRRWRAYHGVGELRDVVREYRDYAADWRGMGDR